MLFRSDAYKVPIGKGIIRRYGEDITIIGISSMVKQALKASELLAENGISAEVIDLRSIKPYDQEIIKKSVMKTGRLLIADNGWECCGAATEIAAKVYHDLFEFLKTPIQIVALSDLPTPAAYNLEDIYYQDYKNIYEKAKETVSLRIK